MTNFFLMIIQLYTATLLAAIEVQLAMDDSETVRAAYRAHFCLMTLVMPSEFAIWTIKTAS